MAAQGSPPEDQLSLLIGEVVNLKLRLDHLEFSIHRRPLQGYQTSYHSLISFRDRIYAPGLLKAKKKPLLICVLIKRALFVGVCSMGILVSGLLWLQFLASLSKLLSM